MSLLNIMRLLCLGDASVFRCHRVSELLPPLGWCERLSTEPSKYIAGSGSFRGPRYAALGSSHADLGGLLTLLPHCASGHFQIIETFFESDDSLKKTLDLLPGRQIQAS